jgi:hypothetical protein
MSLSETYRGARALEAVENFSLAGGPAPGEAEGDAPSQNYPEDIYEDEQFWHRVLNEPDAWGRTFNLYYTVLSQWVPRVPGLYWSNGAKALRKLGESAVQYESNDWHVLHPLGKSQKVFGGVGTLKFPPDESGRRVVSLCGGLNASAGIPAVISPEVWEHHRLGEGRAVPKLTAKWQHMSDSGWAERFPSISGIPKGYLVVERPEQIVQGDDGQKAPVRFHPCTVMEYYKGNAKLYDFVFATADTAQPNHRPLVEHFFRRYKSDSGRYGRYLFSADVGDPWWEAEFESPAALNRAGAGGKSQLELLQARVRNECFKGRSVEEVLELLAEKYDNEGLRRISTVVGIPPAHWFAGGAAADSASELLRVSLERGKVEELLDAVAVEYPAAFV